MTYRPRTVLDEVGARDFKPSGMTGATAASRYVGATASGAPASGTFAVGDFVVDQSGKAWVCTVAGTPGTWTQLAGGSSTLAADTDVSLSSLVGGQVLGYSGALSKWVNQPVAGVAATTSSAQLGANVSISSANTFYDGPSVTLAPGTWQLNATVTLTAAAVLNATAKLWDGSTAYASSEEAAAGTNYCVSLSLSAIVSPSVTTAYKVSAAINQSTATMLAATQENAAGNNATYIRATQLSGNPVGQQDPAVRCRNSANISIPNTTFTALTFDTNDVDQGTPTPQHSTSSNTSRLVCQQAGLYSITAGVDFDNASSSGTRQVRLRLNGTTDIAEQNVVAFSGHPNLCVTTIYRLAVGDYVEVVVYQDSGGSLLADTNTWSPVFMMARIDSGPGALQPNTKVQLDWSLTSDINGTSISTGAWTDVANTSQSFTVDDSNSVVELSVSGMLMTGNATTGTKMAVRAVVDASGTPVNKFIAASPYIDNIGANNYTSILSGADVVTLTGLAAGLHTVKLQVFNDSASARPLYCRPIADSSTEFLNIRVLERKQSTSPPSSTPAPAVRCYNNANISIANSTVTTLTFNTNRFDQGTSVPQHSTATNTSRLTCQQAGVYIITGNVQFDNNSTGGREAWIILNGTTSLARKVVLATSGLSAPQDLSLTTEYYLSVGDYVEFQVWQNSGGALNIQLAANESPEFMMARVDSGGQGFVPIPMVKTANYTILNTDAMVVAGANSLTFTLPAASTRAPGMPLVVKNDNFTATTISRAGSDTIDGATSYSLVGAYSSITLVGDGVSTYRVI
jgi:protein involved in polysaccharide export with SLBB domain